MTAILTVLGKPFIDGTINSKSSKIKQVHCIQLKNKIANEIDADITRGSSNTSLY